MIDSVNNVSPADFTFSPYKKMEEGSSVQKREDDPKKQFTLDINQKRSQKREEKKPDPNELTEDEKQQVRELQKRDQEVRTHENAHMAAAGSLAMGGPQYVYQLGPDGKSYAVGGHVQIDTSPGNTPQETISKARQIRAAALAPADPSSADVKVASAASKMEADALRDLGAEKAESPKPTESEEDSIIPEIGESQESDSDQGQFSNQEGNQKNPNPYFHIPSENESNPDSQHPADKESFIRRVANAYSSPSFSGGHVSHRA
ncbi:MAG: putative metalloprotease CJM1_0395 family protein [Verrucomicrobiota bacterium]